MDPDMAPGGNDDLDSIAGIEYSYKAVADNSEKKNSPKKPRNFIKMTRKLRKKSSPVRLRYMIAFDDEGSRAGFGVDRMVHTNEK